MSIQAIVARISELDAALTGPVASGGVVAPLGTATTAATATVSPTTTASPTFASLLANQSLSASAGLGATTGATAATPAQQMVAAAQAEVGQAEQPPGSNDSPRIADYRSSTAGSGIGPWCAYFVSYAAQQAGAPLGEAGQGFGSVSAVSAWAQRTGRWNPAASGTPPQAGDLIVWGGEHVGIVESVDPDGKIHTIEGNSSNAVTRRTHDASGDGATGYVRLG